METSVGSLITTLELAQYKACVFTPDGALLWRSPKWLIRPQTAETELQVLGLRWQEFIHPEDLPYLLRWLSDCPRWEHIFRAMVPATGEMARIVYSPVVLGDLVITLGEVIAKEAPLPAPPCLAPSMLAAIGAAHLLFDAGFV